MTEMSAVPNSDNDSPPLQAGVKCEALPLGAVNASKPSPMTAAYFATVAMLVTSAARRTPR
jgi:hypothetical protein